MSDKEDLNLDGQQVCETQNNLNRSNDTVELRLKETYCWLLVPFIDQFEDMKTIQWEISDLGGGSDTIATKAARKMLQAEQIITKLAPAPLQMTLDDLLWRDADHIQIKKLWEYLSTYCYLPRLSSYSVLEEAIYQGLASDEYFGLAAMYAKAFPTTRTAGGFYIFSNFLFISISTLCVRKNRALTYIKKAVAQKSVAPF